MKGNDMMFRQNDKNNSQQMEEQETKPMEQERKYYSKLISNFNHF